MKKQVLIIHGGTVFERYEDYLNYLRNYQINNLSDYLDFKDWKRNLAEDLGKNFEVIRPSMPCKSNAKYLEWKIWLEKFIPFLHSGVVLIGHSLGAAFWLKYLAENSLPVKISQLHLVAAPMTETHEPLGSFAAPKNLKKLAQQVEKIYLYYSQDDPVVSFSDLKIIAAKLPQAEKIIFTNYQHFQLENFPELVHKIIEN